jgi:hypothetical protein
MTPPTEGGTLLCRECRCQTGGGEYCYKHRPYTVWPKADGSLHDNRYGQHRITEAEEAQPAEGWTGAAERAWNALLNEGLTCVEADAIIRVIAPVLDAEAPRRGDERMKPFQVGQPGKSKSSTAREWAILQTRVELKDAEIAVLRRRLEAYEARLAEMGQEAR